MSGGDPARDHRGNPLGEGDLVEAWKHGVRYLAKVKEIRPHQAGDGDFRRVTLVREDDGAETESFSDAVGVIGGGREESPS